MLHSNVLLVIWTVTQGIYSRTNKFDGNGYQIMTVQDTYTQLKPLGFWLNIQVKDFSVLNNALLRLPHVFSYPFVNLV